MKYENFNYRTLLILKGTFEEYVNFLKDLKSKNIVSDEDIEENSLFLLATINFKDIAKFWDKYNNTVTRINIKKCSKDEKSRNILKKEGEYQFTEEQSISRLDEIEKLLEETINFSIIISQEDIDSVPRIQLPFDQKFAFTNLLKILESEQIEKIE